MKQNIRPRDWDIRVKPKVYLGLRHLVKWYMQGDDEIAYCGINLGAPFSHEETQRLLGTVPNCEECLVVYKSSTVHEETA